jgi:protease I
MRIFQRPIVFFAIAALFCFAECGNGPQSSEPAPQPAIEKPAPAPEPAPQPQTATAEQNTDGKKVLMVIAPKNFRDEELFETKKIIEEAGHKVTIASTTTDTARGMLGGEAKPEILISQARVEDYDAVVFVGGSGTQALLGDESAFSLARLAVKQGKLLAAICMAPEILANAGLLQGKKATSWSGGRENLDAKGAKVLDEPVVEDGEIVTGSGPAAAEEFGRAIVRHLSGK